ncbi:MAG: hypothetical protein GY746_12375 [Gammaproteobacteria bacterium]|nr:hypothetical protein [Gammaproteobacteria bacterium]
MVDFKPIEDESSGVDPTETSSVLQTDVLKIALNNEVKEDFILNFLTKIAQSISGKSIDAHVPLMESGFDSLALADLAARIQEVVVPAGIWLEVTTTDMYELTTLHAIAKRLIKSAEGGSHRIMDSRRKMETCSKGDSSSRIAVMGMAYQFPGGGNSPEELQTKVLAPGKDCIETSPPGQLHSLSGKSSPWMPITPRPTEMRLQAPASFQQTTMYAVEHLVASQVHSDYIEVIRFGAVGKLDVEALKKALAFLRHRHQVLRTALILQVPQFPGLFLYDCN